MMDSHLQETEATMQDGLAGPAGTNGSAEATGHETATVETVETVGNGRMGIWVERLLSPKSLQRLMACGGGLMILGFVVWLWSKGLFDSPLMAALGIGSVNFLVLSIGLSLIRWTRYQLAGRGITLLAALALPLNLWFYDAQGLIVLDEGGQLWIPALICCGIYALVARLVKDATFVYTFVGGIVMTGMLFLADRSVDHFWELLPHATFLTVVGGAALMAEYLFTKGEGDFQREQFGRAFARAGSLVMVGGLGLLACGQLSSMVPDWIWPYPSAAVTQVLEQQLWGLGLVVSAAGLLGGRSLLQHNASERSLAIACLLWAGVIVLDIFNYIPHFAHLAIIGNLVLFGESASIVWNRHRGREQERGTSLAMTMFGLVILIPMAIAQSVVAISGFSGNWYFEPLGWLMVAQLLSTFAATCMVGTRISDQDPQDSTLRLLDRALHWCGGGILALAVWSATLLVGAEQLGVQILALSVVPIVYAVSNWTLVPTRGRRIIEPVAGSYLLFVIPCLVHVLRIHHCLNSFELLSAVLAGLSVLFAFLGRESIGNRVFATLSLLGALACGAHAWGLEMGTTLCISSTSIGLLLLGGDQWLIARGSSGSKKLANTGYLWLTGSSVAGILLTLNHLLGTGVDLTLTLVVLLQALLSVAIATASSNEMWRNVLRATSVGSAILFAAAFNQLLHFDNVHRIELLALMSGVTLLFVGHSKWAKEDTEEEVNTTISLAFGSLLTLIPLALGLVIDRLNSSHDPSSWWMFHEITSLVFGLVLLGSGILCRIRWTTLSGGLLLATHVLSLAILIQWPSQLQNVSVGMMAGGAIFFTTAVLLSIYRDRLMELPGKVRERKGVFQVLNWR